MKTYLIILICFILFSQKEFKAQSVFPLEEGNEWYYTITNPGQPAAHFSFKVAGDTVMPNGELFWIFEPHDMFYERYN